MGSTNLSTGRLGFEKLFKKLFSETPLEEACESGCVYKRIGDLDPTNEYCFVPWQGGVAECMVRTSNLIFYICQTVTADSQTRVD